VGVHQGLPTPHPRALAVAASGGFDSTALLHATARLATRQRLQVHALHVHHGLQPEADGWMRAVAAQCRRWARGGLDIVFHGQRLQGQPARGESIEAWARRERYRALAEMARAAGCMHVLLAHHRRDQAETVLLQALRGAGPAGLAAMPAVVERDGILWMRPWLAQPREAIEAYLRRWRLRAVSDPSNAQRRFARSRLRARVWPALLTAFPDAEAGFVAVARRASEVRALVDEVAGEDLARVCDGVSLQLPAWFALSEARRTAVLRRWLADVLAPGWPDTLLYRLLRELPAARTGCWPCGAVELRRYRDRLFVVAEQPQPGQPLARAIDLSQPGDHPLQPWQGLLRVQAAVTGGVPAALLRDCQLRPRLGGEQFQSHPATPPRSLKKQFQSHGVPAWARNVPLVFAGEQLLLVPGLGLDARAQACPGEPRVDLRWLP